MGAIVNEPVVTFSDDEQILLNRSFAQISAEPRRASKAFYAHLFQLAPSTRELFVNDMDRQGEKLVVTLSSIILQIGNLQQLKAKIEELGLRHVAYGVLPEHYSATGAALFQMLEHVLEDDFSPEVRAAWEKAYAAISETMIMAIENRKLPQRLTDDFQADAEDRLD
jgi:hemoglobin-like flavoprotein